MILNLLMHKQPRPFDELTLLYILATYIYIYIYIRLHNAILQCVTVHRVPKFTSCHNAIMVVTGRAHCSILLYIIIYIYIYIYLRRQQERGLMDENSVSFQMFLILLYSITLGSESQISVFKQCLSNT